MPNITAAGRRLTISSLTAYQPLPITDADHHVLGPDTSTLLKYPLQIDVDDLPDPGTSRSASHSRSSSPTRKPHGSLTFTNCLALVISLQIGSGIFSIPSQVAVHVPSPGSGVIIWFLGGLLSWTGAASFIELGLRIPQNGGIQEYLHHCYGEFAAFIFVWISIVVTDPAAMAMIAMIFSDYFAKSVCPDAWASSLVFEKCLALSAVAAVTFINCLGIRTGARVANGFLVLKLLAVSLIAFLGLGFTLMRDTNGPLANYQGWFGTDDQSAKQSAWDSLGNYVTALFGILFAYNGWDTVGVVAGDMKNPTRDIPRVLNVAMLVVIVSFLAVNVALYSVLSFEAMRDTTTPVVDFGVALFGKAGGICASLVVAASALGALNAHTFATGKLLVAASQRRYFPGILANLHIQPGEPESDYYTRKLRRLSPIFRHLVLSFAHLTVDLRCEDEVPIYALLINSTLATFYICIGTFDGLVTFLGIADYFFFLIAVLGIYKIRRGDAIAGYTTWTLNPIIFCVVSGLIVLRGIVTDPVQGAVIAGFAGAGWLVYRWRFGKQSMVAEVDMGS